MDSSIKLLVEWEIQLLVLLSFALQLFLFFAGRLRRGNSNRFLRLLLWAAYLGADLEAVYALGYLSRHQDVTIESRRTHPPAFFWAPFILIHLGGQDTITAFAMEDNNLWLRHLLNLVTQVALVLYVFWNSVGKHNVNLLVGGNFVFLGGIIRYGERTWSLHYGSPESLQSSDAHRYRKKLPQGISVDARFVSDALDSMPYVLDVFAERSIADSNKDYRDGRKLFHEKKYTTHEMIRMVSLQLSMIYDDLYTKSLVLRKLCGVILRCISEAAVIVAFVLFHASSKERYSKADNAITYSLFVGCFFLDVCSMFVSMMSPWTWAWLKVQKFDALARLSWFSFCCDIGYPKLKQRWPNLIGQYNFHSWLSDSKPHPRTYNQRVMIVFRKLIVDLFGVEKKKIFFLSKPLDTEYMYVDKNILEYVAREISALVQEFTTDEPQAWQNIDPLLKKMKSYSATDYGVSIIKMHTVTELFLEKCASSHSDIEANGTRADIPFGLTEVCRKLSKYMMYLLVRHPYMLPLTISATATLDMVQEESHLFLRGVDLEASKETVEELARMWTRLLVYAAGKSKAGMHIAQLSGGGELITFAWLLMAHCGIGDMQTTSFELTHVFGAANRSEADKNTSLDDE